MIVFTTPPAEGMPRRAVVLLGLGLVGGAIQGSLRRRGLLPFHHQEPAWQDPARMTEQLRDAVRHLARSPPERLDWVWAAGNAGFAALPDQVRQELALFRSVIASIEESRAATAGGDVRLHLISSAGGIFEGQRTIGPQSGPDPRRPYGEMKLEEERLAEARLGVESLQIYRLSSVYGFIRPGRRVGLVSALIGNTLRQRTTFFSGAFATLRDYVWADDVAEFVADRTVADPPDPAPVSLLASGQPTSIFEMRLMVERATRRKVYIHCLPGSPNAEHITFLPSALPARWRASALVTNIRRIVSDALVTGSVMPRRVP